MTILDSIRGPRDLKRRTEADICQGGLSGCLSREESAHDIIENSHASTVLGWADGLAKANQVPRWVKPVDEQLPPLAQRHRLVAVVEDNSRSGGAGSGVGQALRDAGVDVPLRTYGIPEQFLAHAKRGEVPADIGLTPASMAGRISLAPLGNPKETAE